MGPSVDKYSYEVVLDGNLLGNGERKPFVGRRKKVVVTLDENPLDPCLGAINDPMGTVESSNIEFVHYMRGVKRASMGRCMELIERSES